jgi:prevent-host-death family protein
MQVTIFEAKTKLSQLVREVQKGGMVTITSGRSKTPVARLMAVEPVRKKRLGALQTKDFVLPESFFDPLPEAELKLWNGEGS